MATSSVPSDRELRDRLHAMIRNELLGPAGGEREEVAEDTVRGRYLVGVLAPRDQGPAEADGDREGDGDAEVPALIDGLADDGDASADDGATDRDPMPERALLPSSIGLTFCVPAATRALRVEASWGRYTRHTHEEQIDRRTEHPLRVWRRAPRGGAFVLDLAEGTIATRPVDPELPLVRVRGRVRRLDQHYLVTVFLVNEQEPRRPKDEAFVFQPVLKVTATDGAAIFEKRVAWQAPAAADAQDREDAQLAMAYRRHVEFAVGHGVSVHADRAEDSFERAAAIRTEILPAFEVARATPPTAADAGRNAAFGRLQDIPLDMKALAETAPRDLAPRLRPLATAYGEWIEREQRRIQDPAEGLQPHSASATEALAEAARCRSRIEAGIDLLAQDPQAAEAFRFMNRAMALQRTRAKYAESVRRGETPDFDRDVDVAANRTWYPFQLAFILVNLPALTQLDHAERATAMDARADLLFFPTGGGKTEAYLGLTAYTLAIRRLQGTVEGRRGDAGVAVLMRYTLRLLTLQQFQRATALLCACEFLRREEIAAGEERFGRVPFRIGLWVGRKTTPNRTEDAEEAVRQLRGSADHWQGGSSGSPYQLTACPWCGTAIHKGKHLEVISFNAGAGRTLTFCGDASGRCPFTRRQAGGEGLPIVVVDEEIYRLLPSLVIATVDKFAQMPWKGEVQTLFGQVSGSCERHGFRSPDLTDSDSHPRTRAGVPPANTREHGPLRPPDLIIQDELHLISGPLGSLVGLYETAVDRLCTWTVAGRAVRPKVVASTATIKNAPAQVMALFQRGVAVFPPQGLDPRDSFFSLQREPDDAHPGRLYVGICASGHRLKAALIRVYVAALCAGQSLFEKHGSRADPWLTLVGYFNSMRELGGTRRLVDDDVASRASKFEARGLAKRWIHPDQVVELTSRVSAAQIPSTLDHLEVTFDTGQAKKRRPIDVLLATNMISVGVDVKRLGLMVVCGQPKSSAEYIQATSRVGRNKPGLVLTVFNWSRPRDLSHYETFEHDHATLGARVEPLSVTPFAPGALARGLSGLLVALVRLGALDWNAQDGARLVRRPHPLLDGALDAIAERAGNVTGDRRVAEECRRELAARVDVWLKDAQDRTSGRVLHYSKPRGPTRGTAVPLLQHAGLGRFEPFTCLDSLRDVEPPVKLVVSDGGLDEPEPEAPEAEVGKP